MHGASELNMQYRTLPNTDLKVSAIAFGCMSTVASPTYPGAQEQLVIDTIHAAIDAGITLIDTAPMYGNGESERLLGLATVDRRDKVIIADKASGPTLSKDEILADCETSLKLLQTDYIDLYQIHWPRRQVPIHETIEALDILKKQGKVRHTGVCNFGPIDLGDWLPLVDCCCTDQVVYNMLMRAAEYELIPLCQKHNVGLLCYSPMAQGLLTGRYASADEVPEGRARTRHFAGTRPQANHGEAGCESQTFTAIAQFKSFCQQRNLNMAHAALAWLLHQPTVTAVLAGASRPDQASANALAADIKFTDAEVAELARITEPVKQHMGSSLDVWASTARTR